MIGELEVARYHTTYGKTYRCVCLVLDQVLPAQTEEQAIEICESMAQQVIDLMQVKP